ncbi:Methyltransferase domain-containing protein [Flavobacterium sp. 9AF]|uniref:class I SAM-dependent methyltransferase n=1 Tax=Flavobacterium sp. 9AF TaxID=2653142 RepID=UPI0012EF5584|nr:class I SAM-dependent methyltransferase [Flavobacterium sp. 9AF]VXC31483.1 Methyltransferase domain-containing protein [Flavobacterium sp. 9AF]
MDRLTDQDYWEKYYSKAITQKSQISTVVSEYDKYWDILINQNDNKEKKTIIELGGYPGRYLAYLADKYNLTPTCLDFNSDTIKIKESMTAFGIEDYKIIQADILNFIPTEKYDIVISNGFIEHFEDFKTVLNNHSNYLKKGGTMLVMIPNKRWLRKWYGYLVDYENLKAHNLRCMSKNTFKDFAQKNNLILIENTFFGGFPFSVHQKLNFFQKIVYNATRAIFKKANPFLKRNPSAFYSSSLISIYKKNED